VSLLLGSPDERLSLARAGDALADAARRAGRPSPAWLAGTLYPGLNLNVDLVQGVMALVGDLGGVELPWSGSGGFLRLFSLGFPGLSLGHAGFDVGRVLVLLPLMPLACRLTVGLARVSDPLYSAQPEDGAPPAGPASAARAAVRLRTLWSEGRGLARDAFCLWGMLLLMLSGAMLFLVAPVVALLKLLDLEGVQAVFAGLLSPVLLLVLAYAAVLMVLNQLALHSLAHNRRGVASALTHAWRLVRASPGDALRATLVDFVLFLMVALAESLIGGMLEGLGSLVLLALFGFAGVARAGYWASVYRALGGLGRADNVPGL
jgi:hypothetical protein